MAISKDELVQKVTDEVTVQEKKLEVLKAQAVQESDNAASDVKSAIDDLEPKLDQAKSKLAEIVDASDEQWEELKDSLSDGWDEAKSKLDEGWDGLTDSVKKFFS